jgi:hypothetical protein
MTLVKIFIRLVKIALIPVAFQFKILKAVALALWGPISKLGGVLKDVFGKALEWVTGKLQIFSGWLAKLTGEELPQMKEAAEGLAGGVDDCAEATRAMTEVGKQFVPVTQTVTRKVRQTMDQFIAETEAIKETVTAVEDLVAAYVPLNRAQLNVALTSRSIAEEQKRLAAEMDNIIASGMEWGEAVLPTVTGEQLLLNAALADAGSAMDSAKDAMQGFLDVIKTGIGWVDQMVSGVFKLIDSLMSGGGLKGSLEGIGEIISGVFGGKDSKLGQVAGGIISKLGKFDFGSLFGKATGAATGGGGGIGGILSKIFGGAGASAGATAAGGAAAGGMSSILGFMGGPYGMAAMAMISAFGPQIMDGLKKLGGFVKGLFGGPDAAEKEARQIKASINSLFDSMLEGQAKIEAGGTRWKINNIIVRDSYLAIGKSQAEADAAMAALANTSKQSPAEAQKVVDSIVAIVEQVKAQMTETGLSLTELRNKNINAAIVAAEAAKKAMTDTAVVASASAKKVSEVFTASMTAVKNVATETAAKVTEKFQAIDVSSPIDRFTDRMAGAFGMGNNGDMAAAGAGGGGVVFQDQNAARLEALMERLPTIMERAVQHGLQTSGRKARN